MANEPTKPKRPKVVLTPIQIAARIESLLKPLDTAQRAKVLGIIG